MLKQCTIVKKNIELSLTRNGLPSAPFTISRTIVTYNARVIRNLINDQMLTNRPVVYGTYSIYGGQYCLGVSI